jgi:predicted HNH restriction endonuclease
MTNKNAEIADNRLTCSICKGPIEVQYGGWADGHNAEPIAKGRCCGGCNDTRVIPARLARLVGSA